MSGEVVVVPDDTAWLSDADGTFKCYIIVRRGQCEAKVAARLNAWRAANDDSIVFSVSMIDVMHAKYRPIGEAQP